MSSHTNFEDNVVKSNIAIVLTDIIGSTKFVQKNGAMAAAQWFSAHDRAVMNFIARHNGIWVDNSDGHLMYFASVGNAIAFSFDYKKYLRKNNFPFRSRVGIHWDNMLIVKSEEHMVRGGGKRINLEGIGKNIAARTMSLCGPEQILLSNNAYKQYKKNGHRNPFIPKKALTAMVGLYKFKGVSNPEVLYAVGLVEAQLQPPINSEKAKRVGGKKKIKLRLYQKQLKEQILWVAWKFFWFVVIWLICIMWPFLSNPVGKRLWGVDYWWLRIFDYADIVVSYIKSL